MPPVQHLGVHSVTTRPKLLPRLEVRLALFNLTLLVHRFSDDIQGIVVALLYKPRRKEVYLLYDLYPKLVGQWYP